MRRAQQGSIMRPRLWLRKLRSLASGSRWELRIAPLTNKSSFSCCYVVRDTLGSDVWPSDANCSTSRSLLVLACN